MTVQPLDEASPAVRGTARHAIVTSLSSDSHTWNLVYLELLLEELGCRVTNLGACAPDEVIVEACLADPPDLLVVSSLNGHGGRDGARLIRVLRGRPETAHLQVVIGGKLDTADDGEHTAQRLLAAGFDAVFADGAGVNRFRAFVATLDRPIAPAPTPVAV